MSKTAALTLSIGILAVIDTYLTATILPLPVWVTFIAWASFFAVGGTPFGLVRSVAANFMGILIASCTLIAISLTSEHPVSAAIWVGIGSAAMIVASVIPLLSYPPSMRNRTQSPVDRTVMGSPRPRSWRRCQSPPK